MNYDLVDFSKDVLEACQTTPVVIDFWAAWCGPCKALTPTLEKLAKQAQGKWKFVKINTEEHPQIAAQFQIRSIPNVKMVYKGKLIGEFQGALPEAAVKEWLEKHLPEEFKGEPEEDPLDGFLEAGDLESARAHLEAKARSGKAEAAEIMRYALLELPYNLVAAQEVVALVKQEGKFELEKSAVETIAHLSEISKKGVPINPEAKGAVSNMTKVYEEAAKLLFKQGDGNVESALQKFLEVLSIDRSLDDDGARKACLAIFAMLSEKHPITKAYRRRFSMSLY